MRRSVPFMFARAPAPPICCASLPRGPPNCLSATSTSSQSSSIGCQLIAIDEVYVSRTAGVHGRGAPPGAPRAERSFMHADPHLVARAVESLERGVNVLLELLFGLCDRLVHRAPPCEITDCEPRRDAFAAP